MYTYIILKFLCFYFADILINSIYSRAIVIWPTYHTFAIPTPPINNTVITWRTYGECCLPVTWSAIFGRPICAGNKWRRWYVIDFDVKRVTNLWRSFVSPPLPSPPIACTKLILAMQNASNTISPPRPVIIYVGVKSTFKFGIFVAYDVVIVARKRTENLFLFSFNRPFTGSY